ncbi:MAG: hypothetical protein IJ976_06415, partial [Alistipes sp.]|nr:hypothetical protein [Alistipes sp.]
MKTFRMIGMALVAVVLGFAMSSCEKDDNVDPYKDYPQLIVGKWFNFTPEASMFLNYQADGTKNVVGWDKDHGWIEMNGTYNLEGNQLVELYNDADGSTIKISSKVELTQEKLIHKEGVNSNTSTLNERVHYRVKEQFDITGKYSYLNSAVRVVPAEGKTALQLPDGVTFNGQNSISIDAMHGDRIIDVMKKFFADATFAADGKLNHTMDGETKVKNYTLNGNNLVFNLYEGSDTYKVNATSFPDEDGD